MNAKTAAALLVLSLLLAGCGYIFSGNWEDDPDNWDRAFDTTKPDDVVVVHSQYWRAPHFTYEAGYLFEIAPNAAFRRQLFTESRLQKLEGTELDHEARPCSGNCPEWFAPKPLEAYEVWSYQDDPHSHLRILIDKSTGHLFLGDFQI